MAVVDIIGGIGEYKLTTIYMYVYTYFCYPDLYLCN